MTFSVACVPDHTSLLILIDSSETTFIVQIRYLDMLLKSYVE